MNWLKQWLLRGQRKRQFATLASGTIAAQLISVLMTPLLTRMYTPEHFGVLGLFVAVFTTAVPVVTCKYEQALPLADDESTAVNLLFLTVGIASVFSVVIMLVGMYVIPFIFSGQLPTMLQQFGWLLGVGLFSCAVFTSGTFWMIREKQFTCIAKCKIEQSISKGITEISVGLISATPLGLILGHTAAQLGGGRRMVWAFYSKQRQLVKEISILRLKKVAKKYVNFPLYTMPAAGLNILGGTVPLLLLPFVFGTSAAGLFLVAQRLITSPLRFFGNSLGQVFYSAITDNQSNINNNLRLFYNLTYKLAAVGVVIILVTITSPWWITFLLGENWKNVGKVMCILSPLLATRLLISPLSHVYSVYGKQRIFFLIEVVRLLLSVCTILFDFIHAGSFFNAVLSYSISTSLVYVGHWIAIKQILRLAITCEAQNNDGLKDSADSTIENKK